MFAIIACILAGVGFLLDGAGARTDAWNSPQALGLAALAFLALHLSGAANNRKP